MLDKQDRMKLEEIQSEHEVKMCFEKIVQKVCEAASLEHFKLTQTV